ncbi:MAG: hypothetical protein ACYST9_03875, partial [Planctomycetota bacterium]
MIERDTSINPKPIISFMFAISAGFWAKELAQHITTIGNVTEITLRQVLILISGLLFLLDILCIVWWYARYIYRVQPKAEFGAYFLDFVVCSMFALGANSWTKPITFLLATVLGTTLLLWRFQLLYKSSSASWTDKQILSRAFKALGIALIIATFSTMAFLVIALLVTDISKIL